jgi:MarR family transcriptional regulator, transcriptional regulator for hemolysin
MGLDAEFVVALRRVTQKWRTRWEAELRGSGQTLGRSRALMILSEAGGSALQRDLADALAVENPTLVRLLDGLERQGLVRREKVPGNARANRIGLADTAAPVVAAVEATSADLRGRVLEGIPREELATALGVLRRIAAKLEALEAVPVGGTRDEVRR